MSSEVVSCSEDTALAEFVRLVAASDAGRVPVVRNGKVVGVVARSDLLRALEEPQGDGAAGAGVSIADKLDALAHLQPVFEAVQAVSEPFDGVYLVGGAVRDVLMGEPNFDVDIAVEGDGIAFGRALSRVLDGRPVPHEKFGTAVVLHGDGGRIDVATSRTEFYDYPGALPAVEQASIRQDLYRRDFTINAMAVSLKGEDFGRLVDFFGGLRDLEAGVIRVLHNLSFIDDPTRLFREIRLDHAVHPHLAAGEEAVALVAELDALRERLAPEAPAWRLRLAALARRLTPDELYDWFGRLKLRRRDADLIADAVTVAPRLR